MISEEILDEDQTSDLRHTATTVELETLPSWNPETEDVRVARLFSLKSNLGMEKEKFTNCEGI